MELFTEEWKNNTKEGAPLADRMRPLTLDEFVGQDQIMGRGKMLRGAIESDNLSSLIFWGPPGSGKTTLARIIAAATKSHFVSLSAVTSGIKEVREVVKQAEGKMKFGKVKTILFVDEIHRFNKAQQDAFLPHVENGIITLIGATTENPSFEINSPLLSRSRVFVLKGLTSDQLKTILNRAISDPKHGLGMRQLSVDDEAIDYLADFSDGDARVALNALELAVQTTAPEGDGLLHITRAGVQEAMQKKALLYDKAGEEHFNLISALHKSLRGSDPDASVYWLARMLEAGEEPLYIARRLVRFASEDIGLADPLALQITVAAKEAVHFIGLPEGALALAQAAIYLASAPKSNSLYSAYGLALNDIEKTGSLPPPLHIRNAPTQLMKDLEYGKGYKYAHDYPDGQVEQEYMPEQLRGHTYYKPSEQGYEKEVKERLERWKRKMKKESISEP